MRFIPAFLALLLFAAPLHAQQVTLVASSPAAQTEMAQGPAELKVVFSENIDPKASGMALVHEGGPAQELDVDVSGKTMTAKLPGPLVNGGRYRVQWHVATATTPKMNGSYGFSVKPELASKGKGETQKPAPAAVMAPSKVEEKPAVKAEEKPEAKPDVKPETKPEAPAPVDEKKTEDKKEDAPRSALSF